MEPKKITSWLKWAALIVVMVAYVHYYQAEGEKEVEKLSSGFLEFVEEAPNDIVMPAIERVQSLDKKSDAVTADVEGQDEPAPVVIFKDNEADGFFVKKVQGVVNDFARSEDGKPLMSALAAQAAKEQSKEHVLIKRAKRQPHRAHMQDVLKGRGAKAWCDASLRIDYKGYLPGGFEFDSTFEPEHTPLAVELGAKQIIPGLEDALVGMQQGGQRIVAVPPILGFDGKNFVNDALPANTVIYYDVTLVEYVDSPLPVKSENITLKKMQAGKVNDVARCGDRITIRYQQTQADGNQSIAQKSFVLSGDDEMPLVLQREFYGVSEGAKYSLTVSRALLKSVFEDAPLLLDSTAYGELEIDIISVD